MSISLDEKDLKEKLIRNLKKEVKQIMEEAVTRKFVHEESAKITSLCAAVEMCLAHGLKRRTLGLFKTSSTTALIHKIGKTFAPAGLVSKLAQEIESQDPNRRSNSSGESTSRTSKPQLIKKNSGTVCPPPKYLWIRIALFQKVLAKIVEYLVQNSSKYYEKDALAADPEYGNILSSLSVGPCALDYSKMKTVDHLYSDPPADELVQRHKISSGHLIPPVTPPQPRRPALHDTTKGATSYWKPAGTSGSEEGSSMSMGSFTGGSIAASPNSRCLPSSAREYVESLHQNSRAILLYGKNNVRVQPQKDNAEPLPGYLSLHQGSDGLIIKWSPNHLMNGCCSESENKRLFFRDICFKKSVYWEYAMNVKVEEIVYVHCHQKCDNGGTIVLVGQDGIQYPPLHFPRGGHLLAFLSCLENGLLPQGQLDPPLWTQKGKGKIFPKLRRKARALVNGRAVREKPHSNLQKQEECDEMDYQIRKEENGFLREEFCDQSQFSEDDETNDFVFRILTTVKPEKYSHMDLMSPLLKGSSWFQRVPKLSSHSSSTSSSKSLSLGDSLSEAVAPPSTPNSISTPNPCHGQSLMTLNEIASMNGEKEILNGFVGNDKNSDSLELLCSTMKYQIISRAFYGWLAHCRHLRTVRTHLAGLVVLPSSSIESNEDIDRWKEGLTKYAWDNLIDEGKISRKDEIHARVYLGGIEHSIRKEVWPYLLEYYQFESSTSEREELDHKMRQAYEATMSEWLAVEAIVRQKDKETMAMNLAKLSSESQSGDGPAVDEKSLINEVFEVDTVSLGSVDNTPTVPEEELSEISKETQDNEECSKKPSIKNIKILSEESKSPSYIVTPDEGILDDPESQFESKLNNENADDLAEEEIPAGAEAKPEDEMDDNPSNEKVAMDTLAIDDQQEVLIHERPVSPASSHGGVYTTELLENFGLNIHRIDKDVQRCDRHYWYFNTANLEKLRNIMCTYVWENRDIGYMQGMCDLVAPLLVIFDDEAMTYACFTRLMTRMASNFPHHGSGMDQNFANMRSLIQILDSEMYELMHQNGDFTHFYFCYRWFLLDFKRELVYDDVFLVWEVIWSARYLSSTHFMLFIALALVQYYRAIILENSMDFPDIIKFFNEMAERHDAKAVLTAARNLVTQLQTLIENK